MATPIITSLAPGSGADGEALDSVQVIGKHTNFDATSVVAFSNPGVTASSVLPVSGTTLRATVTIAAGALPGLSDVTVTTGAEVAVGVGLFEVIGSDAKAEILREAVNTYLRQNHVTGVAHDVCVAFIAGINETLRGEVKAAAEQAASAEHAAAEHESKAKRHEAEKHVEKNNKRHKGEA
jgi:hypothetical protein